MVEFVCASGLVPHELERLRLEVNLGLQGATQRGHWAGQGEKEVRKRTCVGWPFKDALI